MKVTGLSSSFAVSSLMLAFLASCGITSVVAAVVPGCDCPATDCVNFTQPVNGGSISLQNPPYRDLAVCTGVLQSPLTEISGITDDDGTNTSICEAVLNSTTFQGLYGTTAPSVQAVNGLSYYKSGFISYVIGIGNCSEAVSYQNTCPADVKDVYRIPSLPSSTPGGCSSSLLNVGINVSLQVGNACRQEGLHVYLGEGSLSWSCGLPNPPAPFMTSADWVKPTDDTRYMCKEFTTTNDYDMYLFITSLGNEPCTSVPGSTRAPTPTPPPSPTSGTEYHSVWWTSMVAVTGFFSVLNLY